MFERGQFNVSGGTVTLLFEFDQLRNFSEILFAAYGHRMDSIDVIFRLAPILLLSFAFISVKMGPTSLSRRKSPLWIDKRPILPRNGIPPSSFSHFPLFRYDLRVPLHRRMARKVRATIKFPGEWLFLTEIHFSSGMFQSPLE